MEKNLIFFQNILQNAQLMYCDLRFWLYEQFYLPLSPFKLRGNTTNNPTYALSEEFKNQLCIF